jgi:hypothetical protein
MQTSFAGRGFVLTRKKFYRFSGSFGNLTS